MALQDEIGLEAGAGPVEFADGRPGKSGREKPAFEIIEPPRGVDTQQGHSEVAAEGLCGIPSRSMAVIEIGCLPCAVSGDDGPLLDRRRVAAEEGLIHGAGHSLAPRDMLLDLVQEAHVVVLEGEDLGDVAERKFGGHVAGRTCVLLTRLAGFNQMLVANRVHNNRR